MSSSPVGSVDPSPTSEWSSALEAEASEFAIQLMMRLGQVVTRGDLGLSCGVSPASGRVVIATDHPGGIVFDIDREPRVQLQIDYQLEMSRTSGKAVVVNSCFLVRPVAQQRPLFTVDYVRDARRNTPAAHYNIHATHDDFVAQLLEAGNARRGKIYRRKARDGASPRLADVHFPVGGHRFRPCLEDVLELLRIELGVDMRDGADEAIRNGREEWRRMQLRAAVSDDPAAAVAELRALGYEVHWTQQNREPVRRNDRVHAI